MITQNRIKTVLTLAAVAMAFLGLTVSASAQITVTPDHIVSGSATGTLVAIDPPKKSGDDGNVAGVGFTGPLGGDDGGSSRGAWEPDGTDDSTQWHIGWINNAVVSWTFDVPDGAIIHNVYAKWHGQGNQEGDKVYSFDEGTPTSVTKSHLSASTGDLVLQWTAADSDTHNTNFERLFTGPITVAGDDGFTLTLNSLKGAATRNIASVGAVVIDVEIYTDPNAPDVDAGDDMITWSGGAVPMDPNVVNNDTNEPQGTLTYLWTAEPNGIGDPNLDVVITDADQEDPNALVTITKTAPTGDATVVTMTLAVTLPGKDPVKDTMTIDVYDNSCLAAEAVGPVELDPTDIDGNCITNFDDFAVMATTWLYDYTSTGPVAK